MSGARYLIHYSVWLQTGWTGFDPRQRQGTFPLSSVFRPALVSAQPPIQWVPVIISTREKCGRVVALTTRPHLVQRPWMSRSYAFLFACIAIAGELFYHSVLYGEGIFGIISSLLRKFRITRQVNLSSNINSILNLSKCILFYYRVRQVYIFHLPLWFGFVMRVRTNLVTAHK
jgi:hypothetical protein